MLIDNIFSLSPNEFADAALRLFHIQYDGCHTYRRFVDALQIDPQTVDSVHKIPFLPVSFFKNNAIITGDAVPQMVFESSGTSGADTSKHYLADVALYEKSLRYGFEYFYGAMPQYCIVALLPHYLERQHSSLVYMVQQWMAASAHPACGFFLNNTDELCRRLQDLQTQHQPTILIGVTFALLDFAERYTINFPELIVMETGGMKSRRRETTRMAVHQKLQSAFGGAPIHSEYGMTELLSQAYSAGNGIFYTPPWMRVQIYDMYNPLAAAPAGNKGGINVIDLAGQYSCAFIQTEDMGRLLPDGGFEVQGRLPNTILRGCNMLIPDKTSVTNIQTITSNAKINHYVYL
jgi:phenylacetate-coenzyme A ligase PaaK-like adenylate-forming protein